MFVAVGVLLAVGAGCFRIDSGRGRKIRETQVAINVIDNAIRMYHSMHGKYPDKESMPSQLIGLMFETDGKEVDDYQPGPGYRLEPRGTVYGPWNGVDKLKRTGDYDGKNRVFFLDGFGQPIWYCPFNDSADPAKAGYVDAEFDNMDAEAGVTIADIAAYATDASGKFYRRDYILMSPSANGKWGLFSNTKKKNITPTDDITNFIMD
jgi:type II secretory pathway pseudopilin PulG